MRKKRTITRSENKKTQKSPFLGPLKQLAVYVVVFFVISVGISVQWELQKEKRPKLDEPVPSYYPKESFTKPADVHPMSQVVPISQEKVRPSKIKIPIIMYHYVEYVRDPHDRTRQLLNVMPAEFERQLKLLKEANYQTYFVKDIPHALYGITELPEKNIVLTFDDGYEDFYLNVLPLLKKYRMKATLYIINDYIGRYDFLNEQEIREIIDSGLVEIGAHTMDHVYLKTMPINVIKQQVETSKTDLEKRFHIRIDTFAYPFGAFNNDAMQVVHKAGFTAAVSVIPGDIQKLDNLYYLYRIRAGYLEGPNMLHFLATYVQ